MVGPSVLPADRHRHRLRGHSRHSCAGLIVGNRFVFLLIAVLLYYRVTDVDFENLAGDIVNCRPGNCCRQSAGLTVGQAC